MEKKIEQYKKGLQGSVTVPGDKSISHRSIMLGAIAKGDTHVKGFLNGADCLSTIACFRRMGIEITLSNHDTEVVVHGRGMRGLKQPEGRLDCGNSGTTTRLISGILAAQNFDASLTGDESIQKRPMGRIIRPLTQMGAQIVSERDNGCAPLLIHGRQLQGICYESPVASAQVKSAVLFAGLYAEGETRVIEPALSRNHSELMLSALGAQIETKLLDDGRAEILLQPCEELQAFDIEVPGDISSAAYFISAALMLPGSDLVVRNVGVNPTRDGILEVYRQMGADITLERERVSGCEPIADIHVRYSHLHGTEIGGAVIPRLIDELPVIAACAALAEGRTVIRDAAELKVKESNRIRTVVEHLQKMGVQAEETEDGMVIEGLGSGNGFGENFAPVPLKGAVIDTHKDHRIAMTFAVLGLCAEGETLLQDAECISISYPGFFEDLASLMR